MISNSHGIVYFPCLSGRSYLSRGERPIASFYDPIGVNACVTSSAMPFHDYALSRFICHLVTAVSYCKKCGGGGFFVLVCLFVCFFLACEDFVRMLNNSFPACAFVFFSSGVKSSTLIPFCRPGSVHSGSVC